MEQLDQTEPNESAIEQVREDMRTLIASLSKQATLTLADLYTIEETGIQFSSPNRETITAERDALMRNLGQASTLWPQLEAALLEVERGVGSLQYMIDPENN